MKTKNYSVETSPASSPVMRRRAFTLVELLVVMGIIILLIGIAVPALGPLLKGRSMDRSINNLTAILELARSQAMSQRTPVYFALKTVKNSDNNSEVRAAAFMSLNGRNDWSLTNLRPISKVAILPNVQLAQLSELPAAVVKILTPDLTGSNAGSYIASYWGNPPTASGFPDVRVAGESFKDAMFSGFDPEGQMGTSGTKDPCNLFFTTQMMIGLIPSRGAIAADKTKEKDGAVITVYGGSDQIRISRP